MAEKKEAEVLYIELVNKGSSGFIKEGTERTTREELDAPETCWLPTTGYRADVKPDGKVHFVPIRWIENCDVIDQEEQKKLGILPNPKRDKVRVEHGFASIVNEGATIGLYDFLKVVFYNEDAPNRSPGADRIFREVKIQETAQASNDDVILLAEAINLISACQVKVSKDKYQFNEAKIDSYCTALSVHGGNSPQEKINALFGLAKIYPQKVVDVLETLDQGIATEVNQAMQHNVIRFDGSTAIFADDSKKIILAFGTGTLSKEKKAQQLADFLKTPEGNPFLTEIRGKVEIAIEKSLA